MGILADSGLILQTQPNLGVADYSSTEGRSWEHRFVGFIDASGDPLDMTGLTGVSQLFDALGEVVVTFTVTLIDGPTVNGITGGGALLTLSPASTAGLAGQYLKKSYRWGFYLTDGADSIQIFGPAESTFTIESED